MRPKITLAAMKVDNDNGDGDDNKKDEEDVSEHHYDIDVVQAHQAINRKTTYSIDNGESQLIGDLGVKFLVQDRFSFGEDDDYYDPDDIASNNVEATQPKTTTKTTFALISIDEDTETVTGIVKKQGDKAMNVEQMSGASMVAKSAGKFVPPKDFRCQVTRENYDDDKGERKADLFRGGGERARVRRNLEEDGHDHEHEHNHDHHDEHDHDHHEHDHDHSHDHDHDHDHLFSEDDIDNLINPKKHRRRTSSTRGFSSTPSHQVDLFIEIDRDFILKNGSNLTTALRYVNTLVTAASTIYEAEVDTRLTVAHVKVTDNYANETNSKSALDKMRSIYGNSNGTWHYNEGNGVDLHHAILGKRLNGGIAFVKSVCSSDYGFGISPNMRGSFLSLDFSTVWDTSVLAHEIGHNFGVLHTYDRRVNYGGFKPPVDRCFIRASDRSSCPTEAQLEGSATLMSYCDACPGADATSLAYTFGGDFVGDDPHDINEWRNNPGLVGGFNNEPKRVPKTMYDHISSRTCAQPNFSCVEDKDCFDWRRCTIDTCNQVSGQCEHQMREDCCGNGICEPSELPCSYGVCVPNAKTCVADCGPYTLDTKRCDKCNAKRGRGNGIMIDMQSLTTSIVLINSIQFRHTETLAAGVTVYTAEGSHIDKATEPEEWSVANSTQIKIEGRKGGYATIDFRVPIAINSESIRSFYIVSTGKLISGHHEEGVDRLAEDDTLSVNYPARITGYPFGGGMKGSW